MKSASINRLYLTLLAAGCAVLFFIVPRGVYAESLEQTHPRSLCYAAPLCGNASSVNLNETTETRGLSPIYGRNRTKHETSWVQARTAELPDWDNALPRYTLAVLERFEGTDKAVILLESLHTEMVVAKEDLPAGADVNTWFTIWLGKKGDVLFSINHEQTKQEQRRAEQLRDQLRKANSEA